MGRACRAPRTTEQDSLTYNKEVSGTLIMPLQRRLGRWGTAAFSVLSDSLIGCFLFLECPFLILPMEVILGWSKILFRFFCNIVWKNPNEPFGQPSKIGHPLFSQVTDAEEISSHFKIKYSDTLGTALFKNNNNGMSHFFDTVCR